MPDLVEALAGRRLDAPRRDRLHAELRALATADPSALDTQVAHAAHQLTTLDAEGIFAVAEARSTLLWDALHGPGEVWPKAALPEATAVLSSLAASWEHDDALRLVLVETDVEGWIHYASLLREVQGAGPLNLALSDRVSLYRVVRERWRALDRDGKIALGVFGAAWPDARQRWLDAPWERQQAFVDLAPLPPPMTATSAGYVEAITAMDPVRHARALDNGLGPLRRRLP